MSQNSKTAQIGALIQMARANGLTIHAIEIGPKFIKLVTAPELTDPAMLPTDKAGAVQQCDRVFGID
mgnify:CR=1 FL=1